MKYRIRPIHTFLFMCVLVFIVFTFYSQKSKQNNVINHSTPTTSAIFTCDKGKTISADFYDGPTISPASPDMPPIPGGSAALSLSDGRTFTLKQTISADGARYANTDESFVFWNKGSGAIVLEQGKEARYTNCLVK